MTMNERIESAIKWHEDFYIKQAEGKHGKRWVNNRVNKIKEEMETIKNAPRIISVQIRVDWKKSSTWGMNPHTQIRVYTDNYEMEIYNGSASGCGYDKESASVAQAFNESPALKKALYEAMEADEDGKPYGVNDYESGLSFASGVGMSCYRNIADWLGFEIEEMHGDAFDGYNWELKKQD